MEYWLPLPHHTVFTPKNRVILLQSWTWQPQHIGEQHFIRDMFASTTLSLPYNGTFLPLPYTLHWNILAVTLYPPLEHSCCYPIPPLEHSCWTLSTGTFLLLPYTLHWNILAGHCPLEHSCCYPIPFTGTFLLLLYTLHWNILFVTVHSPFVPVKVESTCSLHFKHSFNSPFFSFRKL